MRTLFRGLFAALILSTFACSAQDAATYEEGKQYKKVKEERKPADPKRIEVAEFFWYGCGHCYALDPVLERWQKTKAADVDFVRYPFSLGRPNGLVHSKTYYTEEALNLLDKMHKVVFDGIHRDSLRLDTAEQMQAFFTDRSGVLPDVFLSTFNGFMVDQKVRKAENLARGYGLHSVPVMIVGGKYYTDGPMAGSYEKLTKVVDFLVDKVRGERAGKK